MPEKTTDVLLWLRGLRTALKNANLLDAAEKLNNLIGTETEGEAGGIAKVIADWNSQLQLDLGELKGSFKLGLKSDILSAAKVNDSEMPIVTPKGQVIEFDLAAAGPAIIQGIIIGAILGTYLAE